jgi:hypothetical protein
VVCAGSVDDALLHTYVHASIHTCLHGKRLNPVSVNTCVNLYHHVPARVSRSRSCSALWAWTSGRWTSRNTPARCSTCSRPRPARPSTSGPRCVGVSVGVGVGVSVCVCVCLSVCECVCVAELVDQLQAPSEFADLRVCLCFVCISASAQTQRQKESKEAAASVSCTHTRTHTIPAMHQMWCLSCIMESSPAVVLNLFVCVSVSVCVCARARTCAYSRSSKRVMEERVKEEEEEAVEEVGMCHVRVCVCVCVCVCGASSVLSVSAIRGSHNAHNALCTCAHSHTLTLHKAL